MCIIIEIKLKIYNELNIYLKKILKKMFLEK